MIYSTIFRMIWNEDDALDLTQDVFMRAYRKRSSFRGESSPSTWLTRIALNLTYNFLNRNKVRQWNDLQEETLKDNRGSDAPRVFDRQNLELLSPLERAVVAARINEDLPYREIAQTLDTSENSVKVAWSKAVKKLRKAVQNDGM